MSADETRDGGSPDGLPSRRFERLAGFFSERGVQHLVLTAEGHTRALQARGCDLPGELARAASDGFTLAAPGLQLEIVLRAGALQMSWTCPDPKLTLDLARALCD